MPGASDEQLVIAYRQGDRTAFERLMQRYLRPIFGFVYHYVGTAQDADDVVQEVWVKVWKHLRRFDATQRFQPWLFQIAKRTALDWRKKKSAVPFSAFENEAGENALLETVTDPRPLPSEAADHAGMVNRLAAAIARLAPKYQLVVYLRHYHERSFSEISRTLDEPLNTVKSRYRRALLQLRKLIAGWPAACG